MRDEEQEEKKSDRDIGFGEMRWRGRGGPGEKGWWEKGIKDLSNLVLQ
jgi:hypothetical protein